MDCFMWNLHKSGAFTVKSMYRHLVNNGLKATQKIAYGNSKIKIFMWLIYNNAILTKDNLVKRKWVGDER